MIFNLYKPSIFRVRESDLPNTQFAMPGQSQKFFVSRLGNTFQIGKFHCPLTLHINIKYELLLQTLQNFGQ